MLKNPISNKNQPVAVFHVKKKHSWRGNLIKAIEIALVLLVIAGTSIWYLNRSNFSVTNFFKAVKNDISPKIEQKKQTNTKAPKEELKGLLEESKVFEIDTIGDVVKGYEVKSKGGITVIFSNEKNFIDSITTLQTLLAKAKIESKNIKKVDFRFEKIVVEY